MHHKGRQSKPNSLLLLQSDCSSPGFSASLLCAGNRDQVGFVGFFSTTVILIDSLPHLLRKGRQGFGFQSRQQSGTLFTCCRSRLIPCSHPDTGSQFTQQWFSTRCTSLHFCVFIWWRCMLHEPAKILKRCSHLFAAEPPHINKSIHLFIHHAGRNYFNSFPLSSLKMII